MPYLLGILLSATNKLKPCSPFIYERQKRFKRYANLRFSYQ